MSLLAHALAIAATGALVEALPAWVRVELEPHEPLQLAEDSASLLVAVFIGDETIKPQRARSWSLGAQTIELVVQAVLPPRIQATVNGVPCEFDTARGGTRPLYALVHEGLRRAFTVPSRGTWGELLQALVVAYPDHITGMPGKAEKPNTLPVPVIDYAIPCSTIMPPPLGAPAPYPWPDLVAKMRADPAFTAPEADYFEALIAGVPLTDELAALALAGLSRRSGDALGLAPLADLDQSPPFASITLVDPLATDTLTPDPAP